MHISPILRRPKLFVHAQARIDRRVASGATQKKRVKENGIQSSMTEIRNRHTTHTHTPDNNNNHEQNERTVRFDVADRNRNVRINKIEKIKSKMGKAGGKNHVDIGKN